MKDFKPAAFRALGIIVSLLALYVFLVNLTLGAKQLNSLSFLYRKAVA